MNWETARSTLEVFRVSTTEGFTRLGAVDHSGMFENCYHSPEGSDDFGDQPPFGGIMQTFSPNENPEVIAEQMRRNAFYACPGQGVRRGAFIGGGSSSDALRACSTTT